MTTEDELKDALAREEAAKDALSAAGRDVAACALDFARVTLGKHGIILGETVFTQPGRKSEWRDTRDSYWQVGTSAIAWMAQDWRNPDAPPRLRTHVPCIPLTKAGAKAKNRNAVRFSLEDIIDFSEEN